MQVVNLICFRCKNLRKIEGGCNAFPEGIPSEIRIGKNKHKKPLPNQKNNIVFEEL
jgi:hypothetical protein